MKKHLTLSNFLTAAFVIVIAAMLVFPEFKAKVLQGLMQVGLFQPSVQSKKDANYEKVQPTVFLSSTGEQVDISSQKGKVIFINFWATWCPPCIAEMPSIQKLQQEFDQDNDYMFLLVDMDGDFSKSTAFMQKKNFALPIYALKSDIARTLYSGTLPTTAVIDKEGKIRFHSTGANDFSSTKFLEFMQELGKE